MDEKKNWDWQTPLKEIDLKQWETAFNWIEEFHTSPDGEKIAAVVNVDEMEFSVCVNGEPWDATLEKAWSLTFLPDGRLAVLGAEDEEWTVYLDGRPWENRFDYIWDLQYSDDGSHVAAAIQQDMTYGMAVNDSPWETFYENLTCPMISSTGTTAAVVQKEPMAQADIEVFRRGIFSAAINGQAFESQYVNAWDLAFDPSGKNLGYVIRKNRSDYSIVQNDTVWESDFQSAWQPLFIDQGSSMLAPVRKAGKWYLFRDDAPFWKTGYAQLWKLTGSPDQDKVAAVVSPDFGTWTVCEDEKTWNITIGGMISELSYSGDGQTLMAVCSHGNHWDLAVNGQLWNLKAEKLWSPVASVDGRIIAARMAVNDKYHMVVNGKIYPDAYDMAFDPAISPDGDKIMFKTITNGIYSRQILNVDDLL